MLAMKDIEMTAKRVMIRVDMNTPMQDGAVADDRRIRACVPTITAALDAAAAVILVSHLGRPVEGEFDARFSLSPVAQRLSAILNRPVPLARDYPDGAEAAGGPLVMCENARFQVGEKSDAAELAQKLARLCDIFVMDAFGCAHRAHASTHGVIKFADTACAGPLLCDELSHLQAALEKMQSKREAASGSRVAIIGGAKVGGKLELLESFIGKADVVIVGGGIANTFIAAMGHAVGNSLYEPALVDFAKEYARAAAQNGLRLLVPSDVICAAGLDDAAAPSLKSLDEISAADMILDVGPATNAAIKDVLGKAETILWNGPLGAFEWEAFANGTRELAQAVADSPGCCIAGGGDTLLAIDRFADSDGVSVARRIVDKGGYISTGGGSFIEFIQGKTLPAIEALEQRAA